MDSDQNLKVCPWCAESIKAVAKVCPFCCSPQTRPARWRPYLGVGFSVLMLLACISVACFVLFPDAFRPEGRKFAPYRAQLAVFRTSFVADQSKPEFWLSGYISNTGDYPWRVGQLEVRFIEGDGKLVDVHHPVVPEKFVVQPHQEQAFRVKLGKLVFTNSGIVANVRVQVATDGNLAAKTD